GGRVFLDACASQIKYPFSTFSRAYIWPGNATPLVLTEYLEEVSKTPFELISIQNDRHSYLLTTRHWAMNLDRARDQIVRQYGEALYRRFRPYLWGCVNEFTTRETSAYRMLLELPKDFAAGRALNRRTSAGLLNGVRRALGL